MNMTLEQYIINPMGKKNAVMNATAREAIASDYIKRYGRLMMREHSNMKISLYKNEEKNIFIGHFKVPSETINNFYYDVVFEFTADENVEESGINLFKYNCRFFSNDPAFVYTYAHVFDENGLLIPQLRPKMSKKALKENAKEKNPTNVVGYVKTIYFAYLYMKSRGLNNKDVFSSRSNKLIYTRLLNEIENADDKIFKRTEEGDRLRKKKAREKEREKQIANHKPEMAKSIEARKNNIGNINKISGKKKITARKSNRKT